MGPPGKFLEASFIWHEIPFSFSLFSNSMGYRWKSPLLRNVAGPSGRLPKGAFILITPYTLKPTAFTTSLGTPQQGRQTNRKQSHHNRTFSVCLKLACSSRPSLISQWSGFSSELTGKICLSKPPGRGDKGEEPGEYVFVAPCTTARQAPLPMEFSGQEYGNGVPFPTPRDLTCISCISATGRQTRGQGTILN